MRCTGNLDLLVALVWVGLVYVDLQDFDLFQFFSLILVFG